MYRILQSFLLLALLNACASTAKQPLLDPSAFSDAYLERLEQRAVGFSVEKKTGLEMTLISPNGSDFSIYLGNAYAAYQRDPSQLNAILEETISSISHVIENETNTELRIDQVVAVVKGKDYIGDSNSSLQLSGGGADGNILYFEPLNDELVVIYVQDNQRSVRLLDRKSILSLGLQPELLRKHAVANLGRRLTGVQTRENKGLYLFELDGFYEASLMLIDDIWQSPALKVDGEIVVALPARDVLMVTGSNNKNIDFMRATAAKVARQSAYPISPKLFLRRKGGWQILPVENE